MEMDPMDPCYVGFLERLMHVILTGVPRKIYRDLFHLCRGTHERNACDHCFDSPSKEET